MNRWIGQLKIWQKFAVLGGLTLLMLLPPMAYIVGDSLQKIRSRGMQSDGMAPAADVLKLVQLTQQHRGLTSSA